MSAENTLIDAALRGWKSNVQRVDNLFGTLSPEQLEQQVAPGKNRLIYLWGHLIGGERRALAAAWHWQTGSSGTRRIVHFETE